MTIMTIIISIPLTFFSVYGLLSFYYDFGKL